MRLRSGMRLGALLPLLLLLAGASARAETLDGVAAVVDDEIILLSEVQASAAPVIAQLERERGTLPGGAVRQIMEDALQALIDERLVLEMAERLQMQPDDADIDAAIQAIADEEGITAEAIYAAAASQGLPRNTYRKTLGAQIAKMKVVSTVVRSRITITDEEVRELYDERYGNLSPGMRVRLRQILVPWPPEAGAEQRDRLRALMEDLRKSAETGASFAALAAQYSRAPSAANGGLLVLRENEISPAFAPYLLRAQPGSISPVIETEHGLNLLTLVDRFDPAQMSYEQAAPQLRSEIAEAKTMPEFEEWLQELRKNRYIEVVAPELR
jgi:peptidyl-prolyl cis-trans isomerase SurA